MKTLRIFEYRGCVGAVSDIENGIFLNDLKASGQMGIVVAVSEISMSQSAKEALLKSIKREGGSFASTMLTKHADQSKGYGSIGLMGFGNHPMKMTPHGAFEISRDCDLSVLDHIEIDNSEQTAAPNSFKGFVDIELGPEMEVKNIQPIEVISPDADLSEMKGKSAVIIHSLSNLIYEVQTLQETQTKMEYQLEESKNKIFNIQNCIHHLLEQMTDLSDDIERNI